MMIYKLAALAALCASVQGSRTVEVVVSCTADSVGSKCDDGDWRTSNDKCQEDNTCMGKKQGSECLLTEQGQLDRTDESRLPDRSPSSAEGLLKGLLGDYSIGTWGERMCGRKKDKGGLRAEITYVSGVPKVDHWAWFGGSNANAYVKVQPIGWNARSVLEDRGYSTGPRTSADREGAIATYEFSEGYVWNCIPAENDYYVPHLSLQLWDKEKDFFFYEREDRLLLQSQDLRVFDLINQLELAPGNSLTKKYQITRDKAMQNEGGATCGNDRFGKFAKEHGAGWEDGVVQVTWKWFPKKDLKLDLIERQELNTGDIILFSGDTSSGRIIQMSASKGLDLGDMGGQTVKATPSTWSHVALVHVDVECHRPALRPLSTSNAEWTAAEAACTGTITRDACKAKALCKTGSERHYVIESSTNKAYLADCQTAEIEAGVEILDLEDKVLSGIYDIVAIRKLGFDNTVFIDDQAKMAERERIAQTIMEFFNEMRDCPPVKDKDGNDESRLRADGWFCPRQYEHSKIDLALSAWSLNSKEDTCQLFCSEFVALALQSADVLPKCFLGVASCVDGVTDMTMPDGVIEWTEDACLKAKESAKFTQALEPGKQRCRLTSNYVPMSFSSDADWVPDVGPKEGIIYSNEIFLDDVQRYGDPDTTLKPCWYPDREEARRGRGKANCACPYKEEVRFLSFEPTEAQYAGNKIITDIKEDDSIEWELTKTWTQQSIGDAFKVKPKMVSDVTVIDGMGDYELNMLNKSGDTHKNSLVLSYKVPTKLDAPNSNYKVYSQLTYTRLDFLGPGKSVRFEKGVCANRPSRVNTACADIDNMTACVNDATKADCIWQLSSPLYGKDEAEAAQDNLPDTASTMALIIVAVVAACVVCMFVLACRYYGDNKVKKPQPADPEAPKEAPETDGATADGEAELIKLFSRHAAPSAVEGGQDEKQEEKAGNEGETHN